MGTHAWFLETAAIDTTTQRLKLDTRRVTGFDALKHALEPLATPSPVRMAWSIVRRDHEAHAQLGAVDKLLAYCLESPVPDESQLERVLCMQVLTPGTSRGAHWGMDREEEKNWEHLVKIAASAGRDFCLLNGHLAELVESSRFAMSAMRTPIAAAVGEIESHAMALLNQLDKTVPSVQIDADRANEALATDAAAVDTALALRDQLLRDETWYSSEQVATRARGELVDSNSYQYANAARAAGRLLGVRFRNKMKHPAFQFVPATGEPHAMMKKILARLPPDDSGWVAAFWFFQPNGRLGTKRPADLLHEDPGAVLAAAEKDFGGDDGI